MEGFGLVMLWVIPLMFLVVVGMAFLYGLLQEEARQEDRKKEARHVQ